QDNPVSDLRASGLLALRCIVFLGEHYPDKVCPWLCVCVCVCGGSVGVIVPPVPLECTCLWLSCCLPPFPLCDVQMADLIGRQLSNTDGRVYPFGITCVNVTCMCGDVLGVRDTDLSPPKAVFWPVCAS
ncbi:MAG: hypothetical protein P4L40_19130, partial [Terracidiphilus sp.]|nr:hypothetical protein [Terracidiphilus sp.]